MGHGEGEGSQLGSNPCKVHFLELHPLLLHLLHLAPGAGASAPLLLANPLSSALLHASSGWSKLQVFKLSFDVLFKALARLLLRLLLLPLLLLLLLLLVAVQLFLLFLKDLRVLVLVSDTNFPVKRSKNLFVNFSSFKISLFFSIVSIGCHLFVLYTEQARI